MKELKFLKTINLLSKIEKSKFKDFLNSPYFIKNNQIPILYDQFQTFEFKTSITDEEKKVIWYRLNKNTPFDDSSWRKLCNELVRELNNFFAFQQLQKNELLKHTLQLDYITENELNIATKSTFLTLDGLYKKATTSNSSSHLYSFLYNKNKYDLLNYEINIEEESNIEEVHNQLDLFYLSEKIKQLVIVITRKNDLNIPIDISLEHEVLELIKKQNFLKYPEIDIYYRIYQIKSGNESNSNYNDLKKAVTSNLDIFDIYEANSILTETINYCNLELNKGSQSFAFEAMEWYKFGLKNDILFSNKIKFNPGIFMNIVISGIRTKEFTWTENFIEEYQKIIPKEIKKDIVTFSYARLYFNQRKFDDVIEKLRDVEFEELTYNLDAKVLLLATYFEVEEWPAMSSLADAYRTYLHRHEKDITKAKQLRYLHFIKYIKKLSRVKYLDKKAKEKLIEEIQNTEGIVNKGWLIEKAKRL